jgi:hypothetical protein
VNRDPPVGRGTDRLQPRTTITEQGA